jgi:hypothetical protein
MLNLRPLKNYFTIVILSEAKNLYAQFEKNDKILRRHAPLNDISCWPFKSLSLFFATPTKTSSVSQHFLRLAGIAEVDQLTAAGLLL